MPTHHPRKQYSGPSEYVQGLTPTECATLLNVDAHDADAMAPIYDTALAIKERIYGNRVVLFAPLYISNYCVNRWAVSRAFPAPTDPPPVLPAAAPPPLPPSRPALSTP